jgi:extradiol dioxygenase
MGSSRVTELSRLDIEVSDLDRWCWFATEVLGLQRAEGRGDGRVRFRMDDRDHRLTLTAGGHDDLRSLGWLVEGPEALDAVGARLRALGAAVERASDALAGERGVAGLLRAEDPDGLVHELGWGQVAPVSGFRSSLVPGGFVADELGFGHVALSVRDVEASCAFYVDGLGMAVSDHIDVGSGGESQVVTFLHCGPRHHSVALAPFPGGRLLHHLMVETADADDVGRALDRCADADVAIAASLGRHTNDRMTSFYAVTPSGFQVECGHGGVLVDDATWQVRTYGAASTWGHRAPAA